MSVRVILCFVYVIGFSFYAWKNWFVSACAALVLMAFFQHPDMPKNILGIQGMNPWNVLMANVTFAWLNQRRQKGLVWDMPSMLSRAMMAFAAVILWGFIRMTIDPAHLFGYTVLSGFSDYFINNVKWLLIAVIFYDTCRTQHEVLTGLKCVVALYLLLAIQVIRWVPLHYAVASGEEFAHVAYKLIQNEIGYNRVTLSMMLGGASWGTLALFPIAKTAKRRLGLFAIFIAITLGQALTGGRTGYVSWAAVGLIFCFVRWRKLLLLIPVVVIAVGVFLPGVRDRVLFGVKTDPATDNGSESESAKMTSGRTVIWPYVLKKIGEGPIFGYGRMAMQRTGLTEWLLEVVEEDNFGHPHNAYFEQLLDNGILGFFGTMPIYFFAISRSFKLFLRRDDALYSIVGGVASALLLALLLGAVAGQTFYPREGAAGMWVAIGIMFRVSVESRRPGGASWGDSTNEQNPPTDVPVERAPEFNERFA
jgi:O-antigen ligase